MSQTLATWRSRSGQHKVLLTHLGGANYSIEYQHWSVTRASTEREFASPDEAIAHVEQSKKKSLKLQRII